jgi:hypothetical protein
MNVQIEDHEKDILIAGGQQQMHHLDQVCATNVSLNLSVMTMLQPNLRLRLLSGLWINLHLNITFKDIFHCLSFLGLESDLTMHDNQYKNFVWIQLFERIRNKFSMVVRKKVELIYKLCLD